MPWEEVKPGHYERSFDSLESFYRLIADAGAPLNKQHYLVSCTLKLKSVPAVKTLQNAWKRLRQRYPQIAATANEDGSRFCYKVPSTEEVEAWTADTFIIENQSSANEKYEKEPPSSNFLLFLFPQKREILFRTPHWRIDGIGMMDLQNTFLQIVANGPREVFNFDGSEAKYLHPSLDEAAGVPPPTAATSRAADEELAGFTDNQPSINIPTLPNVLPTTTRRLESRFSEETTSAIISACKARGISVTTATHAALVIATLPYAEHGFDPVTRGRGGGKYTGFNAIDLRKYLLSSPFSGPEAPVSIYHTGIPISVDLDVYKDFDSIAAEMSKNYKRNLGKNEPRNIFQFMAEYVQKILLVLGEQPADPLRAAAHPELSSIGVINDHVCAKHEGRAANVEVEDWWIAIEVINRLLLTNVWTWNDRMVLSANWNEAFYEDAFVSRFLDEWKRVVCESLGVNLN